MNILYDERVDAPITAARAKLVRIDGSGHLIMADQPTRFHTVMRDFLSMR